MTESAAYFAVDLGASSGRTFLARFDARRITLEETHRFDNGPLDRAGRLHWDAPRLFDQIKRGLASAARRVDRLDGIGIDTWGVDYALLDRRGELLGLPRHYRDPRTRGVMDRILADIPRQDIYRRTGIQFMPFNTIFQLVAEREEGDALDRARRLLFMPDLFACWLTGIQGSEQTIAGTSQLYDQAQRAWAADLMDRLGIPSQTMPEVESPGTIIGPLSADIAQEVGLSHQPPVVATASHDTAAAVAAVPAMQPNWAYISSGTWSLVGVELPEPRRTDDALADNFTNETGVGETVRFLKNVAGLWLVQECRRVWSERRGECSFAQLTDLARAALPFRSFIDPDDPLFASPGDMPQRIARWCARTAQPSPQDMGQTVRCILESLALKYRRVVQRLEHHAGRPIEVLHLVGGGIQNTLLNQLAADACGIPVIAGPVEATVVGNALTQAMATGRLDSLPALRRVVADSFDLQRYEPQNAAAWTEAGRRFTELLPP